VSNNPGDMRKTTRGYKYHHAKRRNATWHSKQVQFILRPKLKNLSSRFSKCGNGTKTQLLFPHPILLPSVCLLCFYDFDCNMIPNLWVGVQVQVHRTGIHQHWYQLYRHCEFQVDLFTALLQMLGKKKFLEWDHAITPSYGAHQMATSKRGFRV